MWLNSTKSLYQWDFSSYSFSFTFISDALKTNWSMKWVWMINLTLNLALLNRLHFFQFHTCFGDYFLSRTYPLMLSLWLLIDCMESMKGQHSETIILEIHGEHFFVCLKCLNWRINCKTSARSGSILLLFIDVQTINWWKTHQLGV